MPWPQSAAPDLHLERARDRVGRVRPFRFFFFFVISLPEAKRDPFRLVFASFREKIKKIFCMFSLQTFRFHMKRKIRKKFRFFSLPISFRFASFRFRLSVSLLIAMYV
jgi:hypothetical protein